ncbi:hypothetical protein [Amycolatopsis decaplanina]|uniref:Uncharacterized protein n=1 Tax=Amycolatopsis decaplanina DSM 44594 TaxID=1284240 RepID=M2XGP5_9PSEU|nr:hypothetical protein [Amycolatopsis decaplanina]EME60141.1 hypothetical protein H074_13977 [Amycolatopsis decaplanina DSM 44594]
MLFFGAAANELARGLRIAKELEHDIHHWTRLSDTRSEVEGVRNAATHVVRLFESALTAARSRQLAEEDTSDDDVFALLELLRTLQGAVIDLDLELDVGWHRGEQDSDRMRVRRLADAIIYATGKATSVEERRPPAPVHAVEAEPEKAVRSATSRRLTDWAARILPAADRLEYTELFHAELHDLAESGCGGRAQITYALRVLVRAPWLRRELSAPVQERSW